MDTAILKKGCKCGVLGAMLSMGEGCESAVGIRRKCCFPQAILVHTEVSHRTLLWNTSRHVGFLHWRPAPLVSLEHREMGNLAGRRETRPLHALAERSVYRSVHFNYDLWAWKFRVVAHHVWCKRRCSVSKTK